LAKAKASVDQTADRNVPTEKKPVIGSQAGERPPKPVPEAILPNGDDEESDIKAALAKLSPADRMLVEAQQFCPVLKNSRLGSMGTPKKLIIDGQPVFICCDGCEERARERSEQTLATVKRLKESRKP
jgi:hypothetical protein